MHGRGIGCASAFCSAECPTIRCTRQCFGSGLPQWICCAVRLKCCFEFSTSSGKLKLCCHLVRTATFFSTSWKLDRRGGIVLSTKLFGTCCCVVSRYRLCFVRRGSTERGFQWVVNEAPTPTIRGPSTFNEKPRLQGPSYGWTSSICPEPLLLAVPATCSYELLETRLQSHSAVGGAIFWTIWPYYFLGQATWDLDCGDRTRMLAWSHRICFRDPFCLSWASLALGTLCSESSSAFTSGLLAALQYSKPIVGK